MLNLGFYRIIPGFHRRIVIKFSVGQTKVAYWNTHDTDTQGFYEKTQGQQVLTCEVFESGVNDAQYEK